jgi:hypothetical protein
MPHPPYAGMVLHRPLESTANFSRTTEARVMEIALLRFLGGRGCRIASGTRLLNARAGCVFRWCEQSAIPCARQSKTIQLCHFMRGTRSPNVGIPTSRNCGDLLTSTARTECLRIDAAAHESTFRLRGGDNQCHGEGQRYERATQADRSGWCNRGYRAVGNVADRRQSHPRKPSC